MIYFLYNPKMTNGERDCGKNILVGMDEKLKIQRDTENGKERHHQDVSIKLLKKSSII